MDVGLSRRACLMLAAIWIVSIVTAAVAVRAQTPSHGATQAQARQLPRMEPLPQPMVLSGDEVGFRIEGSIDGVPAGRWVIRSRSGEWVEPRPVPGRGGVVPVN